MTTNSTPATTDPTDLVRAASERAAKTAQTVVGQEMDKTSRRIDARLNPQWYRRLWPYTLAGGLVVGGFFGSMRGMSKADHEKGMQTVRTQAAIDLEKVKKDSENAIKAEKLKTTEAGKAQGGFNPAATVYLQKRPDGTQFYAAPTLYLALKGAPDLEGVLKSAGTVGAITSLGDQVMLDYVPRLSDGTFCIIDEKVLQDDAQRKAVITGIETFVRPDSSRNDGSRLAYRFDFVSGKIVITKDPNADKQGEMPVLGEVPVPTSP